MYKLCKLLFHFFRMSVALLVPIEPLIAQKRGTANATF